MRAHFICAFFLWHRESKWAHNTMFAEWSGSFQVFVIKIPVHIKEWVYSGDLHSKNILIANFNLFLIQMVCYSDARYYCTGHLNSGLIFKWWSEYRSINQMVIWIPNYHGTRHLNSKPFDEQTNPHDRNTKLVRYLDPQWVHLPNVRIEVLCTVHHLRVHRGHLKTKIKTYFYKRQHESHLPELLYAEFIFSYFMCRCKMSYDIIKVSLLPWASSCVAWDGTPIECDCR